MRTTSLYGQVWAGFKRQIQLRHHCSEIKRIWLQNFDSYKEVFVKFLYKMKGIICYNSINFTTRSSNKIQFIFYCAVFPVQKQIIQDFAICIALVLEISIIGDTYSKSGYKYLFSVSSLGLDIFFKITGNRTWYVAVNFMQLVEHLQRNVVQVQLLSHLQL